MSSNRYFTLLDAIDEREAKVLGISIDGDVHGWFADDTPARFRAYGWQVIGPVDGHDVEALVGALKTLKTLKGRQLLHILTNICCWSF